MTSLSFETTRRVYCEPGASAKLGPLMAELGTLLPGREVVPASASRGENVASVLAAVIDALPEGPPLYPE